MIGTSNRLPTMRRPSKNLVKFIASRLVHEADEVEVESEFRGGTVYISLRVPESGMGRVLVARGVLPKRFVPSFQSLAPGITYMPDSTSTGKSRAKSPPAKAPNLAGTRGPDPATPLSDVFLTVGILIGPTGWAVRLRMKFGHR